MLGTPEQILEERIRYHALELCTALARSIEIAIEKSRLMNRIDGDMILKRLDYVRDIRRELNVKAPLEIEEYENKLRSYVAAQMDEYGIGSIRLVSSDRSK